MKRLVILILTALCLAGCRTSAAPSPGPSIQDDPCGPHGSMQMH